MSNPQPAAEKATPRLDYLARVIIKHISDAALELAFIRHSLTSDEVDCDDDATIKEQVAATEAFCKEVKEDTFNVLAGDETGCLDESELDESNCELLWLKSVLRSCPLNQSATLDAAVYELCDALADIIGEELSGESNLEFVKDDDPIHRFSVNFGMLRRARAALAQVEKLRKGEAA